MMVNNLRSIISQRKSKVDDLISGIEGKLSIMPYGRIRIVQRKKKAYYFHITKTGNCNGKMIDPQNTSLIQQLIQKNYLQKVLAVAKKEKKAIDRFIASYPKTAVEDVYDALSEDRQRYITPVYPNPDEYAEEWQNTPYVGKALEEGVYTFTTVKGEKVRSKSEKIIADELARNGIPYKYECPLRIGRIVIHPDFTILKKSNMKVYYWEHCGKSDDPDYYTHHIVRRTSQYAAEGIIIGKGLYMTFESSKMPLDMNVVEQIINELR